MASVFGVRRLVRKRRCSGEAVFNHEHDGLQEILNRPVLLRSDRDDARATDGNYGINSLTRRVTPKAAGL